MERLGEINRREVFYLQTRSVKKWTDQLPSKNWLAVFIGNQGDIDHIDDIARQCLKKNVVYVCVLGQKRQAIENAFDFAIVGEKIEKGESVSSPDDFENSPMTTVHEDFEEGFWFAMVVASHPKMDIEKVICIDFTEKGEIERLKTLVTKIHSGWLPSDS